MSRKNPKRRILIVGEGRETEYNYFVGLRNAFATDLDATMTSVSVVRGKGGNARGIVEHAIKHARRFEPERKRGDRAFLLLDTEGAGRAPELPEAEDLADKHKIEIVYSCPALEYWLLCHFTPISRGHFANCASVVEHLNKNWRAVCKTDYDKADQDIFDRLASRLATAREQALQISLFHIKQSGDARRANPSTQVYELVAILLGARTGEPCPISGQWKLVQKPDVTVQLSRGNTMPPHDGDAAHWYL